MAYGLKYTVMFRTVNDTECVVNIETKDYEGDVRSLVGAANPFTIHTETGDLDTPMRLSGATLRVFGSDYLQDLYTSDPQGVRVTLLRGGQVYWVGFVLQDAFAQDYSNVEFVYEIECVCALSTLKYKSFSFDGSEVSFLRLIMNAVRGAGGAYTQLRLSSAVYLTVASNLYLRLHVFTANFFDELGEAMKYYDILSEIATFLGCTFTVHGDMVYLLDYHAIKGGYNTYYAVEVSSWITSSYPEVVRANATTVQALGHGETGARLSRIAGRNRITVDCSLFEVNETIQAFGADGRDVPVFGGISARLEIEHREQKMILIPRRSDAMTFYRADKSGGTMVYTPYSGLDVSWTAIGSRYVGTETFAVQNAPNWLNFTDEVMIRNYKDMADAKSGGVLLDGYSPVLTLKSDTDMVLTPDTFMAFACDVKLNREGVKEDFGAPFEGVFNAEPNYKSSGVTYKVRLQLSVGEYYYDGDKWGTDAKIFDTSITVGKGKMQYGEYHRTNDTNSYDKGLGNLTGHLINPPAAVIAGELRLTIHAPDIQYTDSWGTSGVRYTYIKGISLDMQVQDLEGVYAGAREAEDADALYENAISTAYADAADDVRLRLCTNPAGKVCYAGVLKAANSVFGELTFLQGFTAAALGVTDIAENLIINRRVRMYSRPRFCVSINLNTGLLPYATVTDANMTGTIFLYAGGVEDIKMEAYNTNLIEL